MAYSPDNYTGDGSTTTYTITFPYINEEDVKVLLDGAATTLFQIVGGGTQVEFDTAPANSASIVIYRDTPIDETQATFYTGASIRAQDLNDNFLQNIYYSEETREITNEATAGVIPDGSIGTAKLANSAVTTAKVADGSITTAKLDPSINLGAIPDGGVTTAKLANGAVTTLKLADNSISTAKLIDGAVTSAKLDPSIGIGLIPDGSVTTAKLADSAITTIKIADANITNAKLANEIVDNSKVAVNAAINSTKLAFTQTGTGAAARTVASKFTEYVSVKDFGATGDGVTDDTTAIQNAFNTAAGIAVYFPSGTYVVSSTVTVSASKLVFGDGSNSTTITFTGTAPDEVLNIAATDVTVENLKIAVTVNSGTGSVVTISLSGSDVSRLVLRDLYITGNVYSGASATHGIKLGDATDANDCLVSNVNFFQHNFAFFTGNGFGTSGNNAARWIFENCIVNTVKRGFSFNSDFGTSSRTDAWREVIVSNCHFVNYPVDYDRCTSVGGDSCKRLIVTGCTFRDRIGTDSCIHIENYMDDSSVTNNTIVNCAGGIRVYPLTSRVVVDGNVVTIDATVASAPTPGALASVSDDCGIVLITNTDGQPSHVVVSNNTIFGADSGAGITIVGNVGLTNTIDSNKIVRCKAGIAIRGATRNNTMYNNTIFECGDGINVSSSQSIVQYAGAHTKFVDCVNLYTTYSGSTHPMIMDSPEIIKSYVHGGTGVESATLCPLPLYHTGKVDIFVKEDGAEKFYITSSTLTINDSTFSAARDGKYNFGSLSVADPVMSTASSVLYLQLNSAAALTAEYTVKFRGMMAFDV